MPPQQPASSSTIKWSEVTWYSKLGAIILFIGIVPALCFYIGTQYELAQQSLVTPLPTLTTVPLQTSQTSLPNISTNSLNGFSINYPSDARIETNPPFQDWYDLFLPKGTIIRDETFSDQMGEVAVEVSTDATSVKNCLVPLIDPNQLPVDGISSVGTTTINSVPFFSFNTDKAGIGQYMNQSWYKTVRGSACYALIGTVQFSRGQDISAVNAEINSIVQSFKFTQ